MPPDTSATETARALSAALSPEFELLGHVGSGRTAHVYKMREPALQRLVAVKVVKPEVGADESMRARFEREGKAQAGIHHSNIPAVYRVGRLDSGLPYLILEFLEGRTLEDRLDAAGAVGPAETRRILADVAGALAAAHEKGVVHRDVRPDNVMILREDGRAMLTDFGLVRLKSSDDGGTTRITKAGEILGDPHYASPEQLQGDEVTAETDVYSLGILGYEMLTSTNPFGSESARDLVSGHLSREPVEIPWSVLGNDQALGELLKRALRKDPAKRPRAVELEEALRGKEVGTGGGARSGPRTGAHRAPGSHGSASGLFAGFPRVAEFLEELERRHVYQVAVAYMVAGFFALEGAGNVLEGLGAPGWVYSAVTLIILAGFPVALILAWVYDVTSSGIARTDDEPAAKEGVSRPVKIAGLVVTIAVAVVLGWVVLR